MCKSDLVAIFISNNRAEYTQEVLRMEKHTKSLLQWLIIKRVNKTFSHFKLFTEQRFCNFNPFSTRSAVKFLVLLFQLLLHDYETLRELSKNIIIMMGSEVLRVEGEVEEKFINYFFGLLMIYRWFSHVWPSCLLKKLVLELEGMEEEVASWKLQSFGKFYSTDLFKNKHKNLPEFI